MFDAGARDRADVPGGGRVVHRGRPGRYRDAAGSRPARGAGRFAAAGCVDFTSGSVSAWLGNYSIVRCCGIAGLWVAPYASPDSPDRARATTSSPPTGIRSLSGRRETRGRPFQGSTWTPGAWTSRPPMIRRTAIARPTRRTTAACIRVAARIRRGCWHPPACGCSGSTRWPVCRRPRSLPVRLSPSGWESLSLPLSAFDRTTISGVSDVGGWATFGQPWKQLNDGLGDAGEHPDGVPQFPPWASRCATTTIPVPGCSPGSSTLPMRGPATRTSLPRTLSSGLRTESRGESLRFRASSISPSAGTTSLLCRAPSLEGRGRVLKILRNKDVGDGPPSNSNDWSPDFAAPSAPDFPAGGVAALVASGGHDNTVLYVLTSDSLSGDFGGTPYTPSTVYKRNFFCGRADVHQVLGECERISDSRRTSLKNAYSLSVNPYDSERALRDRPRGRIDPRVARRRHARGLRPRPQGHRDERRGVRFRLREFPVSHRHYYDKVIFGNQCPLLQVLFLLSPPEHSRRRSVSRRHHVLPRLRPPSDSAHRHEAAGHRTADCAADVRLLRSDGERRSDHKNTNLFVALEGRSVWGWRVLSPHWSPAGSRTVRSAAFREAAESRT